MKQVLTDEHGVTIIRMTPEDRRPIGAEDLEQLRIARAMPYQYDEDCPPMSEAMKEHMKKRIEELQSTVTAIA